MKSYPVSFDVPRPLKFARAQVLIRLLVLIALGMVGATLGWSWMLLYILLPAFAASATNSKGGERFLAEDAGSVANLLRWVLAAYAYLALLTDAPPDRNYAANIKFEVTPSGKPTTSTALMRLLTSIPAMLFMFVLGIASSIVWLIAMFLVVISAEYPASLHKLQVGILRFQARMFAYHASLVDEYPPFALDEQLPQGPDLIQQKPA